MTITQKYIEEMRSKLEKEIGKKPKDADLYRLLNIPSQTFSNYARGKRQFDDNAAFAIGHYVRDLPEQIIFNIKAENETNEERKKYWLKVSKNLASSVAGVAGVTVLALTPEPAFAGDGATAGGAFLLGYILYIIRYFVVRNKTSQSH